MSVTDQDMALRLKRCEQFFGLPELAASASRRREALSQLERTGTYTHTIEELEAGARIAWRDHRHHVGQAFWRAVQVIDARESRRAADLADACFTHLQVATNGGRLKPTVTVGPHQRQDGAGWRIHNPQLICYAGYRRGEDVIGDPARLELTETLQSLGWQGSGSRFDILPLLISTPDELAWFQIPPELVLEVELVHPNYPQFARLGLRWHAVPAVSEMPLEIGGLLYGVAPFSSWHLSDDIGARNLGDATRYAVGPAVADQLGLDTSSNRTAWRERVLIELNHAVRHSFSAAGVRIADHRSITHQVLRHLEAKETASRPDDRAGSNPAVSAAATPTWRRADNTEADRRPCFTRQHLPDASRHTHIGQVGTSSALLPVGRP
ncbi:nitric oxide synthase oxygenase (plasmid) [Nocardia sp. CA-084685]|uniref:nitric oxide synthase oxygenase n=1 Tax=Nocardia sp. CA-084685 TaxID=3239970 RepID=UPI003D98341C